MGFGPIIDHNRQDRNVEDKTIKGKASAPSSFGQKIAGVTFPNPIGIAAGFDKNGVAIKGLQRLGFGFVEVGTITPRPQAGNEKPRLFRLPCDQAIINRMGFNNDGCAALVSQMRALPEPGKRPCAIGINLGMNKDTQNPAKDYALGARGLAPFADYLVVNVSSPNTKGLRTHQQAESLRQILSAVREMRDLVAVHKPPIFVKLASDLLPDLNDHNMDAYQQALKNCQDIAALVHANLCDGLIISNTSLSRSGLKTKSKISDESGGLSGPAIRDKALILIELFRKSCPDVPIIGVGGISEGHHITAFMQAGANLVQLYTGLIYHGPGLPKKLLGKIL